MVAASSYQKEGRAAPAMLTAVATIATITGSSAAGTAGRRPPSTPRRRRVASVVPMLTEPPGTSRFG
ncbi:hypothetical protein MTY59_10770 [Mycobacterium senriense]|uniref:Uncharacterized protein n=1 Tax=Mycobacterium senriense TaxID=2775496 RepID=A0ABM7SLH3_9MYCO|nr:hypothetical protein MTY59_10770 [Mycobacterium senriense]